MDDIERMLWGAIALILFMIGVSIGGHLKECPQPRPLKDRICYVKAEFEATEGGTLLTIHCPWREGE